MITVASAFFIHLLPYFCYNFKERKYIVYIGVLLHFRFERASGMRLFCRPTLNWHTFYTTSITAPCMTTQETSIIQVGSIVEKFWNIKSSPSILNLRSYAQGKRVIQAFFKHHLGGWERTSPPGCWVFSLSFEVFSWVLRISLEFWEKYYSFSKKILKFWQIMANVIIFSVFWNICS